MTEHTHKLKQYAQVVGRKCYMYKRPNTRKRTEQDYIAPVFIGIQWLKSKAEAMKFKQSFDA